MTNRVPSSPRSPGKAQPAQQAQQAQRVRRPRPPQEKPKPVKVGGAAAESAESPEVGLWGGKDYDKSLAEVSLAEIETLAHEQTAADEAHAEKAKEHQVELGEQAEREEGAKTTWSTSDKPSAPRPDAKQGASQAKQAQAQQQGAAQAKQAQQPGAAQTKQAPVKPFGQSLEVKAPALSGTSFTNLAPVGPNRLQGTMARAERPPDAFALLKEARARGGFFTEDAMREGHSEDKEDPKLAAAIEECIRLCFGVHGILRIGAGKNDQAAPVIVVVASTGFSESSLLAVPKDVLGFPTLVAIPFELLPLRRER